MQLLEQFGMDAQDDYTMESVMLDGLLEVSAVMEGDEWDPPKAFFTEEKKIMEKIWKWAKADTVKRNNKTWDKIASKLESGKRMAYMPRIRCSKEVKAESVRDVMKGLGYTQSTINAGGNLRYKNQFFAKELSGGDFIEVGITASRAKDPTSTNDIIVVISCWKASRFNTATNRKIYKGLLKEEK